MAHYLIVAGSFGVLLLLVTSIGFADKPGERRYRALIDLTSTTEQQWASMLNSVENLQKALGAEAVQIEVVVHGKALGLLRADRRRPDKAVQGDADAAPALQKRLEQLSDAGVVFAACENTMKREGVSKQDLLPFARTVDSAVAELVRRQSEGWAYVKPG
ncbi:MAG: hypothetical protein AMXMBFR13_44750 [Phycisphaerae bacterium]